MTNIVSLAERAHGNVPPEFEQAATCTEAYAARLFCEDMAGGYVYFVPEWGWLLWDGRRWARDEAGQVKVQALKLGDTYRGFAETRVSEKANEKIVKWLLQFSRYCESNRGIEAILKLAQSILHRPVSEFDTHSLKVNCRNVTLDFENLQGTLPRHYDQFTGDMITKVVPHDWHMGAPCHRWNAFLERIFPDTEVREFVQRAVGYSLLGNTREQVFFILHGTGCNGKSTFLSVLLRILGADYAAQADPRSFLAGRDDAIRNDLADLRGIRFLSCVETGDGNHIDEAMIKAVTGGDPIRARHLYKEAFTFRPEFTLWMATNHKPHIRGTDHAIWRRVCLIPFNVTIPDDERDPDMETKLLRESEGILDWCIRGAVAYLTDGLKAPAGVTAATEEYRTTEDTIGRFVADRCVFERSAEVTKKELYQAYRCWCDEQGEFALKQRHVSTYIQERDVDSYRSNTGHRWIGIRLSDACDACDVTSETPYRENTLGKVLETASLTSLTSPADDEWAF